MEKRSFSLTDDTAARLRLVAAENGFKESAIAEVALRLLLAHPNAVELLRGQNASIRRLSRSGWMDLFRRTVNARLPGPDPEKMSFWGSMSYNLKLQPDFSDSDDDRGRILEIWAKSVRGLEEFFRFNVEESAVAAGRKVAAFILDEKPEGIEAALDLRDEHAYVRNPPS